MGEVVNLRTARKQRARAAKAAAAQTNRATFGRTKAERARDAANKAKRDALLDGAKREED
ncbi:DUF4169 family protein [Stakelama pacifica]|uniref:Uncharacterized protein DUF4169 n=1 Tax=Stakelama pacifica TaxID=517720 RepID=A0A4R6FXH0_9SPHN|nr:DUF4169 family protein [Stakelama pacifica]TDN85715.1 uncharacterized protein DUF4169 [Stakelama pacifica]GGO91837.1 hypothetical protein GCM10011329_07460 [Stakelama pacifica]